MLFAWFALVVLFIGVVGGMAGCFVCKKFKLFE